MPLGTPGDPTASQWRITANSLDSAGDYPVAFNVEATTDNPTPLRCRASCRSSST